MSPVKHLQISSLLRGIENNADKLYQKERIVEKRFDISKEMVRNGAQINVESPLFGQENLPGLRRQMKKNNPSLRSKDHCKLPTISH